MIWHYRELARIQATHTYRAGGCADVEFVVPTATAGLLRRGRLLARPRAGALTLLQGLDRAGAPLAPILTTLRFGVRVVDPCFANFTALDHDPHQTLPVYHCAEPGEPLERRDESLGYAIDAGLWALRPLALLELELTPALHAQGSVVTWTLPFVARTDVLRYYVVAKGLDASDLEQLEIKDAGFGEAGRDELVFERLQAQETDPTALTLAAAGASVVAFGSQIPVARSERPLRKLQLRKNGDVVIPSLPHPGPERASADVIVHLANP